MKAAPPAMSTPAPATATSTKHVLVCVVTAQRNDLSLICAMSLLRMQNALMTLGEPVRADVHFVATFDDAVNALRATEGAAGALIVEGNVGFDAQFALRAMGSGLPFVVGAYPLPAIDWERVKTQPKAEPAEHWGHVYNIRPTGRTGPRGYIEVADAALGVCYLAADVPTSIAARHPEVLSADGATGSFAQAGVYDGKRLGAHQRLIALWGGSVWADVDAPVSSSGPTEFGGCVGSRSYLR
jgi:hypothetical protein